MKKLILIIVMAIFGMMAVGAFPAQVSYAYADDKNKDKDRKKDPAGPPVVKDKERDKSPKPKDPPKKDKKPD